MKSNYLKTKIGGAILGFSLLLGVGMMSSMTAQAQYPNQYPNNDQYRRNRNDQYRQDRNQRGNQDQWNRGRGRTYDNYPNYGGGFDFRQTALNAGYNEGVKAGRKDRRSNNRYDFRDEGAYQNATKDYNSRLGDRNLYQRYFRQAFETGYRDGYSGY